MRLNVFAFSTLLLLVTSRGLAQAPQPDQARATALGHEALDAYGKSDWATAYDRFAAADAAAHSPVFVLYMARCRRSAGDLLGARDLLGRAAGESLPSGAPEPWQKARADAVSELSALEARIPSVVVALRGEASEEAAVSVDGARVSAEALRAPIRLNPGLHTIQATAPGRAPITKSARLVEGDPPQTVELTLTPAAPPPALAPGAPSSTALAPGAPSSTPVAPPPQGAAREERGPLAPGIIVVSAGALGLVAGAVMGGIAVSTANGVTGRCTTASSGGLSCPRAEEVNVSRALALETGSTVAFVAGGAVAAAGLALVLLRPGGASGGATARLVPGLGALRVEGSF